MPPKTPIDPRQAGALTPSSSPAADLPLEQIAKQAPEQVDELDLVLDEDGELVQNPDGSADLVLGQEREVQNGLAFDANLAEHLDESEMQTLAQDLLRKIESDKKAREKRDEQYEEGLRRTGMGNDAPGGAEFKGASKVVHPMLVEACVDFAAATIKELFPPVGPAKTKIDGRQDEKKYAVSQRQQRYLNWQLTEQITEYVDELEQLLTQLPMGGSQYQKFWQDKVLRRVCCEFVPIDDVYLPFACSDFVSAQRVTHVQRLTQHVFEDRVESGFYRDIQEESAAPSQAPDASKAEQANDKIEGRESSVENVDGERIVYEVNTFAKVSIDGEERLPYLISIDEHSGKIVSIYRNWDRTDASRTRLDWMVEWGFIPWRGAYKIGLPHLIGGLSAAATGALRAILDSAHFNNLPGFLRLKGARMGGQTKEINPATGVEVEASAAIDDIRKIVMALPYNPPSAVLMELLGFLSDAARGVVTTAEERIKDASNQMPVGTALALIEQGAKVFSSIHQRLHRSQTRAFKIIARLNKHHLSVSEQLNKLGEVYATRNDFAEALAIQPVSDPNIFSEAQRFAQMQMVLQLGSGIDPKTGAPTPTAKMHDLYEVVKRLYEIAKIPDFERFLPPPEQPEEMNSAAENMASMMGRPLMAFPHQDHFAHIETHMRFITDPFLGGSGMAAQNTMPMMMEHVKQHLGFLYLDMLAQLVQRHTGESIDKLLEDKNSSAYVDKLLAAASKVVHFRLQQALQPLGPVITQVLQQIAQMQTPQPTDPAQAVLLAEKMKQEGKREETDKKLAADREKKAVELQQKDRQHEDKMALEHEKLDKSREDTVVNATLKRDELEMRADSEGAKLEADSEKELARVAAEREQAEADRQERREGRAMDAAERDQDRAFQAEQKDRDRDHQVGMSDADREFQREQSDADRDFQARTKVADFATSEEERKHSERVAREADERRFKAQDRTETRRIKAAQQQRTQEDGKQNAGKAKPKKGERKK